MPISSESQFVYFGVFHLKFKFVVILCFKLGFEISKAFEIEILVSIGWIIEVKELPPLNINAMAPVSMQYIFTVEELILWTHLSLNIFATIGRIYTG